MQAIELVRSPETREPAAEETKQVVDYCYRHGLIALTAGSYSNVVRLLVPLVISDEQMNEGLDVLEAALHSVAENLAKATDLIDKIIADNRQDIRSFTRDGLPELERFLREGRAAAEEIRELSNSLRENPSQLLYQQPQKGVEIPR